MWGAAMCLLLKKIRSKENIFPTEKSCQWHSLPFFQWHDAIHLWWNWKRNSLHNAKTDSKCFSLAKMDVQDFRTEKSAIHLPLQVNLASFLIWLVVKLNQTNLVCFLFSAPCFVSQSLNQGIMGWCCQERSKAVLTLNHTTVKRVRSQRHSLTACLFWLCLFFPNG